jgi:hypothetical protein
MRTTTTMTMKTARTRKTLKAKDQHQDQKPKGHQNQRRLMNHHQI